MRKQHARHVGGAIQPRQITIAARRREPDTIGNAKLPRQADQHFLLSALRCGIVAENFEYATAALGGLGFGEGIEHALGLVPRIDATWSENHRGCCGQVQPLPPSARGFGGGAAAE